MIEILNIKDKDGYGLMHGHYDILAKLPDNPTNGEMIQALFPNAEFDNVMPFTDGRWETMNLDTENRIRAIYKPTQLRTYVEWWNAPYKAESEEV